MKDWNFCLAADVKIKLRLDITGF